MRNRSAALLAVVLIASSAPPADAEGFDLAAPGAVALGRGNAIAASDDSPLALANNPARLAGQRPATIGSVDLIVSDVCFTRWETTGVRPTVCNEARLAGSASVAVTLRLRRDLALGFGLVAPVAVGRTRFEGTRPPAENPTRYAVTSSRSLGAYPTVGLGYAPSSRFRVGAAVAWGFASIDNTSYAYAGADSDTRTRLRAVDRFVPRIALGASIGPFEGVEVASTFVYTQDVDADGDIHFGGNIRLSPTSSVPVDQTVHGVSLRVPQTHQFVVALRYASPLGPRTDEHDRLDTERFDFEVDFGVVGGNRVDDFVVRFPTDAVLGAGGVETPLPDRQTIPHRWRRQYALRIGGDVTLVPSRLSVRVGFAYETDGTRDAYRNIDFTPFQRFTFALGGTLRIGRVDVTLAYAHLHQPTQFVSLADARLERPLGGLANPVTDAQVINAGTYRTGYDLLALDITTHFGRRP